MLEDLTEKLERSLKKITGQGRLSETNISDTLREIRRVLLDADVNYKVAKQFIEDVKLKALGQEVITSVTPGQLITKIIHDELTELMGGSNQELLLNPSGITVILMVGLQGSGKTTFTGKLAKHLTKLNRKVLLTACDIYRPAAIEQLKTLGQQINVPVFSIDGEKDAVKIAGDALEYAKANGHNTVLVDTAGRLHVDEELMNEVEAIKSKINELKSGIEDVNEIEMDEEAKESYTIGKHDYMIESMISKYKNIDIPDIREELQLINEMMNEEGLTKEELEILEEEYKEKIELLSDKLQEKRNSVEKMYNLFNNLKF